MLWFVSHYVFSLEYCVHKDIFLQEVVFGLSDKSNKEATYLNVVSDITKFIEQLDRMTLFSQDRKFC